MTDLNTLSAIRSATRKAASGAGYSEAEACRAAHFATLRLAQGASQGEAIRQALDRVRQDRVPADYDLTQDGLDAGEVKHYRKAGVLLLYAWAIALALTVFSLFS